MGERGSVATPSCGRQDSPPASPYSTALEPQGRPEEKMRLAGIEPAGRSPQGEGVGAQASPHQAAPGPRDADDADSYGKHGKTGEAGCALPAPTGFDKLGADTSEPRSWPAAPRRASRNATASCTGSSPCHRPGGGSADAENRPPMTRHDHAGVCHVPQCVQIRRTSSLAISTAATPHGVWAWRKRPAFNEKAGNGLREISGLPSWARHQSSAKQGYADSASTRPQNDAPHPSPFNGGGWGFRSGSNVPQ